MKASLMQRGMIASLIVMTPAILHQSLLAQDGCPKNRPLTIICPETSPACLRSVHPITGAISCSTSGSQLNTGNWDCQTNGNNETQCVGALTAEGVIVCYTEYPCVLDVITGSCGLNMILAGQPFTKAIKIKVNCEQVLPPIDP